ncbi:MAG: MarR family transcriptional regulator [Clostridiales bacterium]|jgi:DNA-binding MarR family transcriptional regulator|nr:MarR family transcriptional regulator [Clostridiales bacterium]
MEAKYKVDNTLKEGLMRLMLRFKKVQIGASSGAEKRTVDGLGINASEIFFLKSVAENKDGSAENVCATDMQGLLYITKSAISRILNSLEEKGLVNRIVDKNNRRKLIITLTDKGAETLKNAENKADEVLSEVIQRFGESQTKQFIEMFNRFADIAEEVGGKIIRP